MQSWKDFRYRPRVPRAFAVAIGAWIVIPTTLLAAEGRYEPARLGELSLEELANIEITSVAKRPQKLREAASAIYVITRQEIHRSGATTLAEALRLAPNLQVAQQTSSQYAISARGFSSTTANKLLVLIDGRSIYTPLFSGVFWDIQDTLLEDIERIEVISGPGATLWGTNAVNGVINIITRNAAETVGTLATVHGGPEEKGAAARYGVKRDNSAAWRMFAKIADHNATVDANGNRNLDAWRLGQAGFRYDGKHGQDDISLFGSVYSGSSEQPLFDRKTFENANLLGRWDRRFGDGSYVQTLAYYSYGRRVYPGTFGETRNTINLEAQHGLMLGRHNILWGAGYRYIDDRVENSSLLAFLPPHRVMHNGNLFVQDDISLTPASLNLTLGAKVEHNSFSGVDFQPNVRISWRASERHQLWGAISRAARSPSRIDRDFFARLSPSLFLAGGPEFKSEMLTAYELGYRGTSADYGSLSATLFYNRYKSLRNLELTSAGTVVLTNRMEGETSGLELWGEIRPRRNWRLYYGYTYLHENLRLPPGSTDPLGIPAAGNDPRYQFSVRSSLDLSNSVEWDVTIRRVGSLPNPAISSYTALDMRLAWKPNNQWNVAVIGRNLLDARHAEFGAVPGPNEIPRSIFVRATWIY
ncbi:MAG: TonB-dependent receptor [Burkholderiales bacterium]|nr:TonB-dependent receptor [Burkholderiales bacterium]